MKKKGVNLCKVGQKIFYHVIYFLKCSLNHILFIVLVKNFTYTVPTHFTMVDNDLIYAFKTFISQCILIANYTHAKHRRENQYL